MSLKPGNAKEIAAYFHCGLCITEKPDNVSPQEWMSIEAGWTLKGLQVWCKRHDCNIINIDFERKKHPANTTRRAH